MKAELYIRCSCVNGEGPVWDEARQCLHFVDVLGNRIHTWENTPCQRVQCLGLSDYRCEPADRPFHSL